MKLNNLSSLKNTDQAVVHGKIFFSLECCNLRFFLARAYRKKRWICFFIIVFVIIVLAIVLGIVFGKK